jgi:hypothetical protein
VKKGVLLLFGTFLVLYIFSNLKALDEQANDKIMHPR